MSGISTTDCVARSAPNHEAALDGNPLLSSDEILLPARQVIWTSLVMISAVLIVLLVG